MDFRLPENRREAFIRWFVWQLRTTDCDPNVALLNYIFERQEYNIQQKLWLAWIYGTTYHLPAAYVIWNEFPDMENVDLERLKNWNNTNYAKLRYQTDTKYNKGHLPAMFESYRNAVGTDQLAKFRELCTGTPQENYEVVFKFVVKNFHKFGRYLTWFYVQTLKECVGLPLEPKDLLLSDSGSASHRDGLCFVTARDDWTSKYYENGKKVYREIKYDDDKVSYLQRKADGILAEIKTRFPDVSQCLNYYRMETALCSFKKLFRTRDGRYLGYYLDRQAEEIRKVEADGWYGVDWEIMWDYRNECLLPGINYRNATIDKKRMRTFPETGQMPELSLYPDLL